MLSTFPHEIAPDLTEQFYTTSRLGISAIERRAGDLTGVRDLSGDQLVAIRGACATRSIFVSCVAPPIGKLSVEEPIEDAELKRFVPGEAGGQGDGYHLVLLGSRIHGARDCPRSDPKLEWLRRFIGLPHGVPSHDTIRRLFIRLDPQSQQQSFFSRVAAVRAQTEGDVVVIDGKTLLPHDHRRGGRRTVA